MLPTSTTEPLRRLSGGDAPLPGDLLPTSADPEVTERLVWTDISLWEDNPAWRADPDGHLLAPLDAGSGPRGRGILVAHCPERLRSWLDRRGDPTDAEAVTVAISVVRGSAEADACGAVTGTWWLTSTGRPVMAVGGPTPWREETDALLGELVRGASPRLVRAIERARSLLTDPRRLRHDADAVEEALFAVAEPGPLMTTPAVAHAAPAVRARAVSSSQGDALAGHPAASMLHAAVRHHVDGAWADRLRGAWRHVLVARPDRATPRDDAPPRRRVVFAGAAVAAVVLTLGLWAPWESVAPSSADPGAQASAAGRDAAPRVEPTGSRTAETEPDAPAPSTTPPATSPPATSPPGADALQAEAARLVGELASCAQPGCPDTLVEDASRAFPPGAATRDDGPHEVTVIDDYGGVAVLRVSFADAADGGSGADQIVVIVRTNDEWLVRDVYDVADQP